MSPLPRLVAEDVLRVLHDGRRTFEVRISALALAPGDRKAIVGPSGCGKTTVLETLALAAAPQHCQAFALFEEPDRPVDLGKSDPGGTGLGMLRARLFGYVLQSANLFGFLTVSENIALTQNLAGRRDRQRVRHLLRELDIDASASASPADLSVGQRQRVAIARALAHRPRFILADEPTGSLDPVNARRTLGVISREAAACEAAVLIVTHDRDLAVELGYDIVPRRTEDHGERMVSTFGHDAVSWKG